MTLAGELSAGQSIQEVDAIRMRELYLTAEWQYR